MRWLRGDLHPVRFPFPPSNELLQFFKNSTLHTIPPRHFSFSHFPIVGRIRHQMKNICCGTRCGCAIFFREVTNKTHTMLSPQKIHRGHSAFHSHNYGLNNGNYKAKRYLVTGTFSRIFTFQSHQDRCKWVGNITPLKKYIKHIEILLCRPRAASTLIHLTQNYIKMHGK